MRKVYEVSDSHFRYRIALDPPAALAEEREDGKGCQAASSSLLPLSHLHPCGQRASFLRDQGGGGHNRL